MLLRDVLFTAQMSPEGTPQSLINLISHFTSDLSKITGPIPESDLTTADALINQLTMSAADRELALANLEPKARKHALRFWHSTKSNLRDKARRILELNLQYYKEQGNMQALEALYTLQEAIFAHAGGTITVPVIQAEKVIGETLSAQSEPDEEAEVITQDLDEIAMIERRSIHLLEILEQVKNKELSVSSIGKEHLDFLLEQLTEGEDFFAERSRWTEFAHIFYDLILTADSVTEAYSATEVYIYLTEQEHLHGLLTYVSLSQTIPNEAHQAKVEGILSALDDNGIYPDSFLLEHGMLMPKALAGLLVRIATLRNSIPNISELDKQICLETKLFIERNHFTGQPLQNIKYVLDAMLPNEYQLTRQMLNQSGQETTEV